MLPIKKALRSIGLGEKEVSVLMALLEQGPMLAAAIAKTTELNRTTVYGLLKELMGKGLVSQVKNEGADRFSSIAPELLPSYIERKREELAENKKAVEEAVPQLKLLRAKGKTLPKVQFFEGVEGVKQAYEDTIEKNTEKKLRDITGVDAIFRRLGSQWVEYYLAKRVRAGISCKDLAPESEWARKVKADEDKYMLEMKFLPKEVTFNGEIDIYDNKVAMFSYAQENPIALIIEDETMAEMMKKLFDYIESTVK